MHAPPLPLVLDLVGTFAFALNGALTAVRVARLDVVGVLTLGALTALGGGVLRDVVLGATPPATFGDWRYLATAFAGGLLVQLFSGPLGRWDAAWTALDAAGLGLFAVTGTLKALDAGLGAAPAVLLGALSAVGGGTLRDVLVQRLPSVLSSGLYAVPALLGAAVTAAGVAVGGGAGGGGGGDGAGVGLPWAVAAAVLCFGVRMAGVALGLNAPGPRVSGGSGGGGGGGGSGGGGAAVRPDGGSGGRRWFPRGR